MEAFGRFSESSIVSLSFASSRSISNISIAAIGTKQHAMLPIWLPESNRWH
jgi:hypothetical protein